VSITKVGFVDTFLTTRSQMHGLVSVAQLRYLLYSFDEEIYSLHAVLFFWRDAGGTCTPKYFVNLTGESKNFKNLEFQLNLLQMYYGYLCDLCPLTFPPPPPI
jgi:hypothetical protein